MVVLGDASDTRIIGIEQDVVSHDKGWGEERMEQNKSRKNSKISRQPGGFCLSLLPDLLFGIGKLIGVDGIIRIQCNEFFERSDRPLGVIRRKLGVG